MAITLLTIEQQVQKALLEALLCFKKEKKAAAKKLCIALSGGIDSVVLLTIVDNLIQAKSEIDLKLEAFHVDHGISQFSGNWREFCRQHCLEKNIPFSSVQLKLEKVKQQSLEADAREARYKALCEHAQHHTMVILGQHQSDQTETFLLQVKRGAGLAGLACMPLFTLKQDVAFARPLLAVSKQSIVEFAKVHKLKWCEDNSNSDESFDRNFLRMSVIPVLHNKWPHINSTISRVADNCALALQVNNEYMALLAKSLKQDNKIDLQKLAEYSDATKQTFLQFCLVQFYHKQLSKVQLESLFSLCDESNTESAYLNFGNLVLERFKNMLVISQLTEQELETVKITSLSNSPLEPVIKVDLTQQTVVRIDPFTELSLISESLRLELENKAINSRPEGNHQNYAINQHWCEQHNVVVLPSAHFELHKGASHLKFKYQSNRPTKTLKTWFQEWQVSPIQRRLTSTITCKGEVCAVLSQPLKVANTIATECTKPVFVSIVKTQ